jgi:hypothetical protein
MTVVGGFLSAIALAGAVDYVFCCIRNRCYIQGGEIEKCVVPAVQNALVAGLLAKMFGPVPLPLQIIDFVLQNRDLLQSPCHALFCDPYTGQTYYLRASRQIHGAACRWALEWA